jgi:hypothetical protein
MTAAARWDGLRMDGCLHRALGARNPETLHRPRFPRPPQVPFSRPEPNEGEVSAACLSLQQCER